ETRLIKGEGIIRSPHAMERFIGRCDAGGRGEEPIAKQVEPLFGCRLDLRIAVAEMPVGRARADARGARGFIKREALRPMFGNQPSSRGDERLFEVSVMVAVSGEL